MCPYSRATRNKSASLTPTNPVGCDDHGDVTKAATAQPVSMHGQATAFLIGQADPAAHVPTEDAVFFDQEATASCCRWSSQPTSAASSRRCDNASRTAGGGYAATRTSRPPRAPGACHPP